MDGYAKLFVGTNGISRNKPPLKRGNKQYQYSADNQVFLDLISYIAHVGHRHPLVSSAGQQQLQQLVAGQGFHSKPLQQFNKTLHGRLRAPLSHYYLLNSGSEANDLALRMARTHTGGQHYIVFDGAYHGSLSCVLGVSPLASRLLRHKLPSTTHRVSPPDLYGGPYTNRDTQACDKYVEEVAAAIASIEKSGGKLAAFIHEPIAVACGVVVPPPGYCRRVYELVRKAGGVVIADETCCGLGRAGEHFWTFEHFDVVPDIVTVGKALGNGFPTALTATTKDISEHLGDFYSTFGGNPVACRVARAVLDVVHGELMLASSRSVGKFLLEELRRIQHLYRDVLGQVRGLGLCLGLVIVSEPHARRPDRDMAYRIINRLHEKGFLVWCSGLHNNVITLTPPLCITQLDARQFTSALRETLDEFTPDIKEEPEEQDPDVYPSEANSLATSSPQTSHPSSTASSLDSHTLEDQKLDDSGSLSEHSLDFQQDSREQSLDGCRNLARSAPVPIPMAPVPRVNRVVDDYRDVRQSALPHGIVITDTRTVPNVNESRTLSKDSALSTRILDSETRRGQNSADAHSLRVSAVEPRQPSSKPKTVSRVESLSESDAVVIPLISLPRPDRKVEDSCRLSEFTLASKLLDSQTEMGSKVGECRSSSKETKAVPVAPKCLRVVEAVSDGRSSERTHDRSSEKTDGRSSERTHDRSSDRTDGRSCEKTDSDDTNGSDRKRKRLCDLETDIG